MLKGSVVAIVTPMRSSDSSVDFDSLANLIDWHIAEGTNGIVIVGTTGESPAVSFNEHCDLIKFTVEKVQKRIPVIAGTGANSTQEAIDLSVYAKEIGADFGLSVVPYYNKPTQEGLYRHFSTIAETVDFPQILYNVPGRTVADISNETVIRLSVLENIIGLKDATADLERVAALIGRVERDFAIYSGDDGSALGLMMLGGHGVISVTANIVPNLVSKICDCVINKADFLAARNYNQNLVSLNKALFLESNPIPVKWALAKMGKIPTGIRLPLTQMSNELEGILATAMQEAGISVED